MILLRPFFQGGNKAYGVKWVVQVHIASEDQSYDLNPEKPAHMLEASRKHECACVRACVCTGAPGVALHLKTSPATLAELVCSLNRQCTFFHLWLIHTVTFLKCPLLPLTISASGSPSAPLRPSLSLPSLCLSSFSNSVREHLFSSFISHHIFFVYFVL